MFPVVHPQTEGIATDINNESHKPDKIPSLSHLPSLPVARQPHAYMAIDTTCSSCDVISSSDDNNNNIDDVVSETGTRA